MYRYTIEHGDVWRTSSQFGPRERPRTLDVRTLLQHKRVGDVHNHCFMRGAAFRAQAKGSAGHSQVGMSRNPKPKLVFQDTAFNQALLRRCPLLKQDYQVLPWLWNGHAETIFAALTRRKLGLQYERKLVQLEDGGVVALDCEPAAMNKGLDASAPVVIILPGLTGGSHDSYVQFAVKAVRDIGMRGIVYNPRGLADSPVLTPKLYSASYTGDFREAVRDLKKEFPESRLYAVGFSLGANLLLNYLGEERGAAPFEAAVSLCNPFNLMVADVAISKGFSRLYANRLGTALGRNFAKHWHLFDGLGGRFDLKRAAAAATIREFDDALTIHSFGWASVDDYYNGSSCDQRIGDIQIPMLAIQAENDPLAVAAAIPEDALKANWHCLLAVTPTGGHLGWMNRDDLFGGPWTDGCVQQFLTAVEEMKAADSGHQPGVRSVPSQRADLHLAMN